MSLPEIPGLYGNASFPLVLNSGMSRAKDFQPALRANVNIGIDIQEMSSAAIELLAIELAESDAWVFVDSGAFALLRSNIRRRESKVLDFAKVFAKYDELQAAVCRHDKSDRAALRVFYSLPDVVGDQQASLDALRQFAELSALHDSCLNCIIPLQCGALSLSEMFDQSCEILGKSGLMIVGIPSKAEAVSAQDFLALLEERGDEIFGVHILGAASDKSLRPRIEALKFAGYDGPVSADANRLRSMWSGDRSRPDALVKLLSDPPPVFVDDFSQSALAF